MKNGKLTIEFDPTFENVDMMRAAISGICLQTFSSPELSSLATDFSLAVTEAMNNAVEHSGSKNILVELTVTATTMIFKMTTGGIVFNPTLPVSFPDLSSHDDMPEGGFGLAIIREMVDRMAYEYQDGKNIFTLEKTFYLDRKERGDGI